MEKSLKTEISEDLPEYDEDHPYNDNEVPDLGTEDGCSEDNYSEDSFP